MAAPYASCSVKDRSDFVNGFELLRRVCLLFIVILSQVCPNEISDVILCRSCGHQVGDGKNILQIQSPLSTRRRNDSILGKSHVLIQLFKNPEGNTFEVITLSDEDVGVYNMDGSHPEHSWFPEFAWQISLCPKCGTHIGWYFTPTDKTSNRKSFYGLILDKLLHQGYADSLLVVPKSYQS